MKNLATKNTNDFTVTETGEAFISQRKAAELLGVARSTLQSWLTGHHNYDANQGLTADLLQKAATHYALFSKAANDTARNFAAKLMEAGAKAYIYHQAGYTVNAVPKLPQTKLEWMKLAVETEEALQLETSAHLETKHTLKLANIRQIHERHISLEYMVVDIRNQHPEIEITYRDLLQRLREHKMIRKHGVIPLLNQNKSVPFTIRSGGDGSGNRISYIIPEERAALISWYASKTNQDI